MEVILPFLLRFKLKKFFWEAEISFKMVQTSFSYREIRKAFEAISWILARLRLWLVMISCAVGCFSGCALLIPMNKSYMSFLSLGLWEGAENHFDFVSAIQIVLLFFFFSRSKINWAWGSCSAMLLVLECRGLWLPGQTCTKVSSKILRETVNLSAAIKILAKQVIHA